MKKYTFSRAAWTALFSLCLLVTVPAVAQTDDRIQPATPQPDPDPAEPRSSIPLRTAERTAPARSPTVLEETRTPQGVQTVIQLPVTADTYIASERPNQNFGSGSLFLGYNLAGDNYGAQRLLVRFDTSAIPPSAEVTDAHFRLYLTLSDPPNDDPMGTVLRRVASPWDEFTVTWNSEPEWTPIDDVTYVGSDIGSWYSWQIDDVAATWINETQENYGLEIIGDEAIEQRERAFYSRETTTDFHPQLIVAYTVPDDDTAPTSTVDPLPDYVGRSFDVSWSGEDEGGSGIEDYDVQYRVDGGDWQAWLTDTTAESAAFDNAENGRTYEFRVRAVDEAGNEEPFGPAEAETTADTQPPTTTVEPLPDRIGDSVFTVRWSGTDNGGTGIASYDVRYRYNRGEWILWQANTVETAVAFSAPQDGLYEFDVRAVDNLDRVEAFPAGPQAGTLVDAEPPFIIPRIWLPTIPTN